MSEYCDVNERLDQTVGALKILAEQHGPTGLIDASGQTLTSLADLTLSPLEYTEISGFCGITEPKTKKMDRATATGGPIPLGEDIAYLGKTNLFGVTAFALKNSIVSVMCEQGLGAMLGDVLTLPYVKDGKLKDYRSGLVVGCLAMGMSLSHIAQSLGSNPDTIDEYVRVARQSLPSLPVRLADMHNIDNRKMEVLYGIKVPGTYDRECAAEELGAGDPADYRFEYDPELDRVAPTNWDAAHPKPYIPNGRCSSLRHRSFSAMWSHLITATSKLPELFEAA